MCPCESAGACNGLPPKSGEDGSVKGQKAATQKAMSMPPCACRGAGDGRGGVLGRRGGPGVDCGWMWGAGLRGKMGAVMEQSCAGGGGGGNPQDAAAGPRRHRAHALAHWLAVATAWKTRRRAGRARKGKGARCVCVQRRTWVGYRAWEGEGGGPCGASHPRVGRRGASVWGKEARDRQGVRRRRVRVRWRAARVQAKGTRNELSGKGRRRGR